MHPLWNFLSQNELPARLLFGPLWVAPAVRVEDESWRPDELIRQDGIDTIAALRQVKMLIVMSSLAIIIAIAAAGEEEVLIRGGVIDHLES